MTLRFQPHQSSQILRWQQATEKIKLELDGVRLELRDARAALDRCRENSKRLQSETDRADATLKVAQARIATLERQLQRDAAKHHREVEDAEQIHTRKLDEISRRSEQDVAILRRALEQSEMDKMEMEATLAVARDLAGHHQQISEQLRSRIASLRSTRSWRFSAPIRRLGKLLRR